MDKQEYRKELLEEGNSPESIARVMAVIEALDAMTNDERVAAFLCYCRHCGSNNPRCQCWNDE